MTAAKFTARRHAPYSKYVIATVAPVQSYLSRSQKCRSLHIQSAFTELSWGQRTAPSASITSSGLSDSFQLVPVSESLAGMTAVTNGDGAEKARLEVEPTRLPTPCESDAENNPQMYSEQHENVVPVSPTLSALTPTTESTGTQCNVSPPASASSSSSLSPLDDEPKMPPTPRLRTCQLPTSPSIATLPPLGPPRVHTPPPSPRQESPPQGLLLDLYSDEPLIRPLADGWSSLDLTSWLSLTAEPSDEEHWPFKNVLGLWVDAGIYVSAWDAGGIIRATRFLRPRI